MHGLTCKRRPSGAIATCCKNCSRDDTARAAQMIFIATTIHWWLQPVYFHSNWKFYLRFALSYYKPDFPLAFDRCFTNNDSKSSFTYIGFAPPQEFDSFCTSDEKVTFFWQRLKYFFNLWALV